MNLIERYKRLIVVIAFAIVLAWAIVGSNFPLLGKYSRLVVCAVCGAGILVFLLFYREESKPEQATQKDTLPPPPAPQTRFIWAKNDNTEDIFSGFKQ